MSTPDGGGKWAWRGVFAAIPLLVVAFHWIAARPDMAFNGSDLRYFFFGVREAVAEALRHGDLPLWQRGFYMGYPLVADPQAAVFAPTTWLTLPWSAPRALTLATLLHLTIAGWGMAAWMRLRSLSPASGLLAAVLFALGAKQTVHVVHWNFAATTAFWPWMLAGLEGFAAHRRSRWLLLAAVATTFAWLGGSPQMAHFGTLVAGLYALRIAFDLWPRRRADAAWAVAIVPIGFLLAAVLVLPTLELSRMGARAVVVDYAFVTSWRWPSAWGLALYVLPHAYGDGRWGLNLWEATGYVGIPALALAVAAPARRRGVILFAVLALLGPWLALGEQAPLGLHWLLYKVLPGYGSFRVPTRGLLVTAFAVAVLAAEGLEALRRDPTRARLARSLGVFAATAALALLLPRLPGFPFDPASARKTAWFALMVSSLGALWVVAVWRGLRGAVAGAAIVALAFYDPWYLFSRFNDVGPASAELPSLRDFSKIVPSMPEPRRVGVIAKWGASVNAPLRNGWEGTMGYGPMSIQRVRELLEATRTNKVSRLGALDGDATFPSASPTSPLWPLLATPIVISDRPQEGLPVSFTGMREWENPMVGHRAAALPRVFWTGSWEVAPDDAVTEPLLRAAAGNLAVLAEAPVGLPPSGPPEGPVAAEAVQVDGPSLTATVVAPRDGLLVIADPFYPGWTATLDGKPVPILRANFAFQAVPVTAGRHELRLAYRNRWVGIGAAVSLGTLALLLAALAVRSRRTRGEAAAA
ncbi:MAG: YfhO family protein [Deltaproteobacteria bacterium]